MGKSHEQRVFINSHRSGGKFNLAISNMLPVSIRSGNKNDTSFHKSVFYVVTELIPLYLIMIGGTGNSIGTGLDILPSV